jgi:hypothetical protein
MIDNRRCEVCSHYHRNESVCGWKFIVGNKICQCQGNAMNNSLSNINEMVVIGYSRLGKVEV